MQFYFAVGHSHFKIVTKLPHIVPPLPKPKALSSKKNKANKGREVSRYSCIMGEKDVVIKKKETDRFVVTSYNK